MRNLNYFRILGKPSIKRLPGGAKRRRSYFVAIMDTQNSDCVQSVIHAQLLNQMGSQRSPSYPNGYELFDTSYGSKRFDIDKLEFPVPRISFRDESPVVTESNKPARILDPTALSDFQRALLIKESKRFELQCKIRQLSPTLERFLVSFELFFDLLGGKRTSNRLVPRTSAEFKSLAEEFEVRLSNAEDSVLRELLRLLKIPDRDDNARTA